ncbi:small capsid protein [Equid gammaherpesvirus 2]|nr:small capsid protein [Equid gammaherpesvirus 2]
MPRDEMDACELGDGEGYQPLRLPRVQGKLEEINPIVAAEVAALERRDRSDAEYEKVKMLYVIYLRVHEIYDDQARIRLGVRRKKHLGDLTASRGAGMRSFEALSSMIPLPPETGEFDTGGTSSSVRSASGASGGAASTAASGGSASAAASGASGGSASQSDVSSRSRSQQAPGTKGKKQ